jgi:hypothetical protein
MILYWMNFSSDEALDCNQSLEPPMPIVEHLSRTAPLELQNVDHSPQQIHLQSCLILKPGHEASNIASDVQHSYRAQSPERTVQWSFLDKFACPGCMIMTAMVY